MKDLMNWGRMNHLFLLNCYILMFCMTRINSIDWLSNNSVALNRKKSGNSSDVHAMSYRPKHQPPHQPQPLDCKSILETRLMPPPSCSVKKYEVKRLLITGSARSGTTMIAKLISALFFPISQDSRAPTINGMVSWELAAKPTRHCSSFWGRAISCEGIRFNHVFHQVRNPLDAIRSMLTEYNHWQSTPTIVKSIIPTLDLKRSKEYLALQVWVEWNSHLDKYPFIPVHRVEDVDLISLVTRAGWNVTRTHPHVSKSVVAACYDILQGHNKRNQTNTTRFTWSTLFDIDQELATRARAMATRYGYIYHTNGTLKSPTKIKSNVTLPLKVSNAVQKVIQKCRTASRNRRQRYSTTKGPSLPKGKAAKIKPMIPRHGHLKLGQVPQIQSVVKTGI